MNPRPAEGGRHPEGAMNPRPAEGGRHPEGAMNPRPAEGGRHPEGAMTPRRLAVLGANGRMGRAVVRLARDAGFEVVLAAGAGDVGRDAGELAGVGALGVRVGDAIDAARLREARAEVLVDFSAPSALAAACAPCAEAGVALVSGTTGLDETARAALETAAGRIPVLWEPNMSVGVHVLSSLLARAIAALGPGFDVEIVEAHHRMKVDAPSGTALRLAEVAREAVAARAPAATPRLVHGREGRPGARSPSEIGVLALRGGDVVGDHTAFLFGDGERLELSHRASSRDLFARGALRAASWLAGRAAGRYSLSDVLG
jgi:4-hydroxy-tetrahydrodipicolinate reductase